MKPGPTRRCSTPGLYAARCRYAELGLTQMLPLDRVLVGAESSRPGAFGGFHHPNQGYRHLQMVAVVTMYGPMEGNTPEDADQALLDLLRAYAHDCLHYGSRRRYIDVAGTPTRTQYGINFRRLTGQSYSAADPEGSGPRPEPAFANRATCWHDSPSATARAP